MGRPLSRLGPTGQRRAGGLLWPAGTRPGRAVPAPRSPTLCPHALPTLPAEPGGLLRGKGMAGTQVQVFQVQTHDPPAPGPLSRGQSQPFLPSARSGKGFHRPSLVHVGLCGLLPVPGPYLWASVRRVLSTCLPDTSPRTGSIPTASSWQAWACPQAQKWALLPPPRLPGCGKSRWDP